MRRTLALALPLVFLVSCGTETELGDQAGDSLDESETGQDPGDGDGDGDGDGEPGDGDGDGDGDPGDGDGDPNDTGDPVPCGWNHSKFPQDYGFADDLGQDCGQLDDYDLDPVAVDAVLACLDAAYEADEAAWAHIEWIDYGEEYLTVNLYVRPPKPPNEAWKPRRISTVYSLLNDEQGGTTKKFNVAKCEAFIDACDLGEQCGFCDGAVAIPCGQTD